MQTVSFLHLHHAAKISRNHITFIIKHALQSLRIKCKTPKKEGRSPSDDDDVDDDKHSDDNDKSRDHARHQHDGNSCSEITTPFFST